MHLADSALPVGGFAFSSGLEAAATCGLIASQPELERYLQSALLQWLEFEGPFLHAFSGDAIDEPLLRYDRMMLSPTMRKASFAQGRGWLRVCADLFPASPMIDLRAPLDALKLGPHYLPLLVFGLQQAGATEAQVRELYLFTLVRDQCSAAIRLGLLGPGAAQALQTRLEQLLQAAQDTPPPTQPKRFSPLMELAQMLQPALYTKLFQN